jgi:hypothetical protein
MRLQVTEDATVGENVIQSVNTLLSRVGTLALVLQTVVPLSRVGTLALVLSMWYGRASWYRFGTVYFLPAVAIRAAAAATK